MLFIEKTHSARRFSPQGHRVRAPCPNKRRKDCVCHRVSNNEDADPHTILNTLLERKLYSYQNARFKQKQSVKTKKRMMCPPGVPYIAVAQVVTSWAVAGQQVVFLYCMIQTQVTLKAFPIATPRGRSSKFPWKGTEQMFKLRNFTILYIKWAHFKLDASYRSQNNLDVGMFTMV